MSVEYEAVGGIGIRVPNSFLGAYIYKTDMDESDALNKIGVTYITYGSAYVSGDTKFAWVMPYDKYSECVEHANEWVNELNRKIGNNGKYTKYDLEVISELFIY